MIYLDYTATTPIDDEVLETYVKTSKNFFANSSSLHKLGQMSNYMYEKASNELLETLGIHTTHNVIFTANATEANNISIFGIVNKFSKGKIITTKIEHPSVYETIKSLENKYEIVYLNIDKNGLIDLNQLKNELNEDVILVSVMWVNNILGTIQPIKEVIELVKKYKKARLHVDMVQGFCKVINDFDLNQIDLMTFSTHKIYGPKGIGGLFFKKGLELKPILYGSKVQFGINPGTFDLSLIVCTTKAFKKFYPLRQKNREYVKEIFLSFYNKLKNNSNIVINTPVENISYYILNISIPKTNGETIVHLLEQNEIYVSTGSACSSKLKKSEKTIFALTKDEKLATSTIRFSFSHLVKKEDIDKVCQVLESI